MVTRKTDKADEEKMSGEFCQYKRPADGLPWFVNVIVTTHCNLRCPMCMSFDNPKHLGPKDRVLRFFERLADWLPSRRMVILTGGEPLLHPYIIEFVGLIASRGLTPALNTNTVAMRPRKIHELAQAGLQVVNVSLDGLADVHDKIRCGPGLYQGVMDTLQYLSANTEFVLSVVSVISAASAAGLPALVKKIAENPRIGGIQFQALVPTLSRPWNNAFFNEDPLWPRRKEEQKRVLKALDDLVELRSQGFPINNPPSQFEHWRRYFQDPKNFVADCACRVAEDNLVLRADGTIQFCNYYDQLGTLEDDPKTLWESERAKELREEMSHCRRSCNWFVNCCYVEKEIE